MIKVERVRAEDTGFYKPLTKNLSHFFGSLETVIDRDGIKLFLDNGEVAGCAYKILRAPQVVKRRHGSYYQHHGYLFVGNHTGFIFESKKKDLISKVQEFYN